MIANLVDSFRLEKSSVIKVLLAKNYKPCEIYRRMCDVYCKAYFSINVYKWERLIKEGRNSIQEKNRSGSPMVSTTEMMDLVNALILGD